MLSGIPSQLLMGFGYVLFTGGFCIGSNFQNFDPKRVNKKKNKVKNYLYTDRDDAGFSSGNNKLLNACKC